LLTSTSTWTGRASMPQGVAVMALASMIPNKT
jgi:hypothetical protein